MSSGDSTERTVLCVGLTCVDIILRCKSFPLEDADQRSVILIFPTNLNSVFLS